MLVVRGRAFYRGKLEPLSLGIEDGKIVTIRKLLTADEDHDYGDDLVLPGCIDLHVHFRDPGLTYKEDFPSGTISAAIGGVTTVVDMPNTRPPVTTRDALDSKIAAVRGRAAVDYGLFAAPRTGKDLARLAAATAFKVYMAESTGGIQIDEEALADVLHAAGERKRLVVAHAEDARHFRETNASGLEGHATARPKESEVSALNILSRRRGTAPVHVAHVTCVEALEAVPPGATTEVTPHHLFLDYTKPLGPFGKVNPPLRSRKDREALWKAFVGGRIDVVASDHAPHTVEEKEEVRFPDAPSGLPGVATSFPLLLRKVKSGDVELERIISAMATRPAAILGLAKGAIEIGRDADLVVVDPRRIEKVTAKRARYKCGWTPFEGMEASFPEAVYVRGEQVLEDYEPVAGGLGQMICPGHASHP